MKTTIAGIKSFVLLVRGLLLDFALEMRRPGKLHEQPHQQRRGDRKARLVKEPDGNKAENQRIRRAPEPEVLMQDVENDDRDDQKDSFHNRSFRSSRDLVRQFAVNLKPDKLLPPSLESGEYNARWGNLRVKSESTFREASYRGRTDPGR